jgi:rhodanese-related sulfurtransferase
MSKSSPVTDPLAAGRDVLSRGEWDEARALLEDAVARDESPEAVETLAMAAWWLDDAGLTIESRERAYRLYRARGDEPAAARMAISLAWDALAFRGEPAVASERVTAGTLEAMLESPEPPLLLDVRTEREHCERHIDGAVSVPLNRLERSLGELPRDRAIVVHCVTGYRSAVAASILQRDGFGRVADLVGGLAAWKR